MSASRRHAADVAVTESGAVYPGVCAHYCQQGSQGQAPTLNTKHTLAHK